MPTAASTSATAAKIASNSMLKRCRATAPATMCSIESMFATVWSLSTAQTELRTDGAPDHIRPLIRRRIRDAFDADRHGIAVIRERQIARYRDRPHAWQGLDAADNFVEEGGSPRGVRIFHLREIDVESEQLISAET